MKILNYKAKYKYDYIIILSNHYIIHHIPGYYIYF